MAAPPDFVKFVQKPFVLAHVPELPLFGAALVVHEIEVWRRT